MSKGLKLKRTLIIHPYLPMLNVDYTNLHLHGGEL